LTDITTLAVNRPNPHLSRARLLALATLAALPLSASAQVSLATIVEQAQRNSSAVHLAQANVNKAAAALTESRDAVIPSVSVSSGLPTFPQVGFTGTPPSIWSASVQSLIFGFPQKNYISSASFAVKSAKASLADAREQVALDASTAYIDLDATNTELDLIRQQEDAARRLVEIEQQRAEAGVDPLSEVLEARLTLAQMHLKRVQMEAHAEGLAAQLASLTGLKASEIKVDHASIPEIPQLRPSMVPRVLPGIEAAQLMLHSHTLQARGDQEINYLPQLSFGAQYNRNTTLLNDVNKYFASPLPSNNFSSGISIQVPLFNMSSRAKARESSADALKSRVEAEQAERQNDIEITRLSGTIRELDALAEVATLKQQIAQEQLKTVLTQLELGSGSDAAPQLTPKAEQQARIDERQKQQDALDATLSLAKARLGLLRALGHMSDWLDELKTK
jgi:outer membrane protein TolC